MGGPVATISDTKVYAVAPDGTETAMTNVESVRFVVEGAEPARAVVTFLQPELDVEVLAGEPESIAAIACRDELHAREVEQERRHAEAARTELAEAYEALARAADRTVNECICCCPACRDVAGALGVVDAPRQAVRAAEQAGGDR